MKNTLFVLCIIGVVAVGFHSGVASAEDVNALTMKLKDCNKQPCLKQLESEAEQIFDQAGDSFNEDFGTMGNEILANHSGQSLETIAKDTDRDFFLSAEDAKKYGLVDEILSKPPVEVDEESDE